MSDFPSTRYQGSKRKIIPWIHQAIEEKNIKFNTALDAFGGTGMVAYLFKKMNKEVTYNDYLKFNYLIGKAIIENSNHTIEDGEIDQILHHKSHTKFVQKTFKGFYFLDKENAWIDNVVEGIETTFPGKGKKEQLKKSVAYCALFQACIIKRPFNLFHRKNLSIRLNDVERNFGNKTTWERSFSDLFRRFIAEVNKSVFDNNNKCKAVNKSVFVLDPYGYDLVYLDPPYYAQNGDHETADYLKCYHFLEGLSKYSNWGNLIDTSTSNLRLLDKHIKQDFNHGNIYEKFEELLVHYRHSKLIVSYKNGGLPSIDHIIKLMKKIKRNVSQKSIHYKYALNRQNGDAKKNREVLIIGM